MSNRKMTGLSLCLAASIAAIGMMGCAPTRYSRGAGEYVEDKALSTRVNTALFRDPVVSGFDVNVQSWRGQIQLTGFVDTEEQKQRAEQIVQNVPGVEWVKNDLIVKTQAPGAIGAGEMREPAGAAPRQEEFRDPPPRQQPQFREETRIREQQLQQERIGAPRQGADQGWQQGIGKTDPVREAREEAELREAAGAPPPAQPQARRPGAVEEPQGRPQTFVRPGQTGEIDQMLEQRVKQELQRDANLSPEARNIQISTQNGRVILRGTVRSEAEREAITERVREIMVEDQLQVRR
jgi:hyperosmotically inducible periplasmic protein